MPADTATAVIDRITGDIAVLLVESGDREVHVPRGQLPADVSEGTVVIVDANSPSTVLRVDHEATQERRDSSERRLRQIRRSRSSGRFPR